MGLGDETRPLIIGLTGGIGSGKSTVARIFSLTGIPVYDADDASRWITDHDPEVKQSIIREFGMGSYQEDGLNRPYLAKIVFDDPDRLQRLNAIVHPRVGQHFKDWVSTKSNFPFVIKEAAIMIESGSHHQSDVIILVTAPEDLRIKRVMNRDKVDEEAVRKRISNQFSDEEKKKFADFIIENNEEISLIKQVMEIQEKLKMCARKGDNL